GRRADACAPLLAPRCRALDDRTAAALGDVRPLGHRRALDEPASGHRRAHRLHLRRASRRGRDRRARVRAIRRLGRRHGAHARRLPLRARVPVVRPEPEVRQSQRLSGQGGSADAPRPPVEIAVARSSYSRHPRPKEAARMQYVLLIYDDPKQWENIAPAQMESIYGEYMAVSQLPNTTGGAQLQPTDTARSVRVKDGEALVTDGPFAETKEALGGFYVIEADSPGEAEQIAARVPSARMGGTVEVRPVVQR